MSSLLRRRALCTLCEMSAGWLARTQVRISWRKASCSGVNCRSIVVVLSLLNVSGGGSGAEGLDAGLGAAQDQRVHIMRAFVGVDHLQVHDMADHAVFVTDAVAAMHVARHAGDVQGLAAVVALHQRGDLGGGDAFVL